MKKTDSKTVAQKGTAAPAQKQVKETTDNDGAGTVLEETAKTETATGVSEEVTTKGTDVAETTQNLSETSEKPSRKAKVPEGMQEYFKLYPDNDIFYRTADGQVFLKRDKQWAVEHQKHIGGELETIKRP
jgi:hypothetical protein